MVCTRFHSKKNRLVLSFCSTVINVATEVATEDASAEDVSSGMVCNRHFTKWKWELLSATVLVK